MDKQSILIVDDNPINLSVLRQLLENAGYNVRPANSGKLALAALEYETVDLILLDIRMPNMDGYEVCQTLKSKSFTQDIPVIFISALSEAEDKAKGFECGCLDYISKPFHDVEVLARVKTHLQLYHLQRELKDYNAKLEAEVKHRTTSLRESNEGLRTALAAKQDFLMLMNHEFRPPLNGILGMSAMLKERLEGRLREYCEMIEESGWRLFKLVDDILTVVQHGDIRADKESNTVDIQALFNSIVSSEAAKIEEKQLQIEMALNDRELCALETPFNVSRLRHILDNVFDNALKFTPSNGQIKIDVQYMGQDVNQLFIHISDTGPGIPEAARQRIFEPFFQVDPILSRHHEGPGLGLTIVRNLLELHGGKIEAFNHEGGGAVFNITLPAKA